MLKFVTPSSELLDRQTAEEVGKSSSVLLKGFGRTLLALLGGCEDEHIDVTVPASLLVLVPGFHLLATSPEMINDLQDTPHQA